MDVGDADVSDVQRVRQFMPGDELPTGAVVLRDAQIRQLHMNAMASWKPARDMCVYSVD